VILAWKERGLRRMVDHAAEIVVEAVARPAVDELTFVPPDRERSLTRGHHPAAALATALGARWGIPSRALLVRTGDGRRQAGLTLADRRANVRTAFVADGVSRASVCLVDDVYTTGATAHAAASALRKVGARTVEVVTLARAVR
jgi:predicted amidophosphoribosyltransferase